MSQDEQLTDSKRYLTFGKPQRKLILQDLKEGLERMGMRASNQGSFCGEELPKFVDKERGNKFNHLLHRVLKKHVPVQPFFDVLDVYNL